VAVWKANDSADLQRLVILKALETVTASEESAALQFMLKALDAPGAQRLECARLGRGNSLEKSVAASRSETDRKWIGVRLYGRLVFPIR
jgi:hypothetical protein